MYEYESATGDLTHLFFNGLPYDAPATRIYDNHSNFSFRLSSNRLSAVRGLIVYRFHQLDG